MLRQHEAWGLMQDKRYAYIFLTNGQLLKKKTPKKKTRAGWERVAFERFVYDGDRLVYRKLRRRLTGDDKQLHAKKGEPPKGWVDPIGWIAPDSGEPWLTINDKGKVTVHVAAAKRLRSARGSREYSAAAEAATAVLTVLHAQKKKRFTAK
jgi:hypothetical protein